MAETSMAGIGVPNLSQPLLQENETVSIDAFNSAVSAMPSEIVEDFQLTTPK